MKVTLYHHECYAAAGLFFVIFALTGMLTLFQPPAPSELGVAVLVIGIEMVCSVAFFLYARAFEVLDETGIRVKTAFSDKTYPWSDVEKLKIEKIHRGHGVGPQLSLKIKNRKRPLKLTYTKRSLACVSYYYGAPDEDKWNKPTTLL